MRKQMDKIACLITTDSTKRGVFMGFIDPADMEKDNLMAENVRMCIYWDKETKGVLGLAATGPTKGCRISKATKKMMIKGVTAVVELTKPAIKAWEKEPWG
jgi:hypothetical protein